MGAIAGGFGGAPSGGGGFGSIFGGIFSALSQFQRAQNTASQLEGQAAIQNAQAQILEFQAQQARQQAEADKEKQRKLAREKQGKLSVGFLSSGVSLEGSPLAVLGEQAGVSELELQQILHRGEVEAINRQNQASIARFRASQLESRASGITSAAGLSLLGGLVKRF